MKKTYRLTQEGVDELKAERDALVGKRTEITEAIRSAREQGDLAENSEYQAAMAEKDRNYERVSELESIIQNAEIIKKPKVAGKVQLGSNVTLKGAGKTKEFQVVGTVEADPLNGKISDESPIGQALLGKQEGDTVEIKAGGDLAKYKIANIA